jgi:DNA uptake protein ComE-like DNA-binding protein
MEARHEQERDTRGARIGLTGRGLKWERMQCWYLLSVLTVWLYWVPFVYTGLRAGHPRWIGWGLAYGLPAFVLWFLNPGSLAEQVKYAMGLALVVGTVHAWLARGEFLERLVDLQEEREALSERTRVRREAAQGRQPTEPDDPDVGIIRPRPAEPVLREPVLREHIQRRAESARPYARPVTPARDIARPRAEPASPSRESIAAEAPEPQRELRFDFNQLTDRDFALLPDMGMARGRQAVALREQLGGFRSFDHFAEKMGLGPAACDRLRPLFVEPPPPEKSENSEYRQEIDGRYVLDINLVSVEALTTLRGISHEIARKAVQLREADGPFKSAEDFRFRLGLTLDQFVPLQGIISTYRTPGTQAAAGRKPKGRIVDV